jgi:hypothetical protein
MSKELVSLIFLFFLFLIQESHCQSVTFSSDIPLVVITTKNGETIKNEPKITTDMKIISNGVGKRNFISDPGNIYSGKIGIEIRGRYSASLPQKPYGFETRDAAGENLNVSLLGMPAENDWVLLANYNDKSFLRNVLAFEVFKKMGHYAPRMRFCEVILNDEYKGIYLLGEKIKQDSGRVDIAKLRPEDNSGDDLTGGYIIKNDYFTATDSWLSSFSPQNKPGAKVYFVYHDPGADELSSVQKTYIQGYINTFETILYCQDFRAPVLGYKSYIDVKSFADYFILGEISRNVDAYKKSRFFFKDKERNGGLLHSGPPWDYDWAFRNLKENCIHMNQTNGSGWAYKINECAASPVPPSWEVRMLQDNEFSNLVNKRYFELRKTILSKTELEKSIDSVALLLEEAQERHFGKWNILGINAGTPEYGIQPLTYSGEIEKFKNWLDIRLAWLDANMEGFATSIYENKSQILCRVFPNPATDLLFIESDSEIETITVINTSGAVVKELTEIRAQSIKLNISDLNTGLYLIKIQFFNGLTEVAKIIKN